MTDEATPPRDEGEPAKTMVWLVRPRETLTRLIELIAVEHASGERELYGLHDWQAQSVVQMALAVTSFSHCEAATGTDLEELDPETVDVIKTMGFALPAGQEMTVSVAAMRAMQQGPGGFSSIVVAQSAFHSSPYVFKHLWEEAGMPPITVCHDDQLHVNAAAGAPMDIPYRDDQSLVLSLLRRGRVW